jgi:DNA-directed RNA polymerase specialized sigma24 family protein
MISTKAWCYGGLPAFMVCFARRRVWNGSIRVNEPAWHELRIAWRQLSRRNDWLLADDEDAFLHRAAAELVLLGVDAPAEGRIRRALLRAYGALLYDGVRARQDRAAHELWLACYRLALRDGWPQQEAELLAQETIARVLEKLHTLRSPHSIISWTLRIYRTVREGFVTRERAEGPVQDDEDPAVEPADPADIADEVEQRQIDQQISELLRIKLPNSLERQVLLRVLLLGDLPRDVARDLDLPLHRTRLAKSRALQRLRGDEQFMQRLGELGGDIVRVPGTTGAYDHGPSDS